METITSRNNSLIISSAKLKDKKYRDESGMFIYDGFKLLSEAVSSGNIPEYIFTVERACERAKKIAGEVCGDRIIMVSDSVFEKLSTEKSPEGVISVGKYIDKLHYLYKIYSEKNEEADKNNFGRCFFVSSVRDPGNIGTIIRSAAAFGVDTLFLSSDCADIYNSRAVRASMGALFRQKIVCCEDIAKAIKDIRSEKYAYTVYAATLKDDSSSLDRLTLDPDHTAFVVGNEGHGLGEEIISACTGSVIIPMAPRTESLNAAIAASVLMWESYRRSLG